MQLRDAHLAALYARYWFANETSIFSWYGINHTLAVSGLMHNLRRIHGRGTAFQKGYILHEERPRNTAFKIGWTGPVVRTAAHTYRRWDPYFFGLCRKFEKFAETHIDSLLPEPLGGYIELYHNRPNALLKAHGRLLFAFKVEPRELTEFTERLGFGLSRAKKNDVKTIIGPVPE